MLSRISAVSCPSALSRIIPAGIPFLVRRTSEFTASFAGFHEWFVRCKFRFFSKNPRSLWHREWVSSALETVCFGRWEPLLCSQSALDRYSIAEVGFRFPAVPPVVVALLQVWGRASIFHPRCCSGRNPFRVVSDPLSIELAPEQNRSPVSSREGKVPRR